MGRSMRLWLGIVILCGVVGTAQAEVRCGPPFGNSMVLQREIAAPVWGKASPGEKVEVRIAGQIKNTAADQDGRWLVKLDPMTAGGPHEMTITGDNTITFKDVLVGEVWICSGQSNMAYVLRKAVPAASAEEKELPQVRYLNSNADASATPLREMSPSRAWQISTATTADNFSAVAFFFGRELHKALECPIGLIAASIGGSAIECWIDRASLEASADGRDMLKHMENYPQLFVQLTADYETALKKWEEDAAKAKADGKAEPRKPRPPESLEKNRKLATVRYNSMIAPLQPYAIRGAIWYQGEANTSRAYQYRKLLPMLIQSWRTQWGQGDFPFLFVQLPGWSAVSATPRESSQAELREAQAMTLSVPNTGMAVAIDLGEPDIHPKNKLDVGKRLALVALAQVYGRNVPFSGPRYDSMSIEGDKVRLTFKDIGGGLVIKGDKLVGFAIAGADKAFVWADAVIDGATVVVSSPKVPVPAAVRYAWSNNPECNLYNTHGLPAAPFRTDDWPGITAGKP